MRRTSWSELLYIVKFQCSLSQVLWSDLCVDVFEKSLRLSFRYLIWIRSFGCCYHYWRTYSHSLKALPSHGLGSPTLLTERSATAKVHGLGPGPSSDDCLAWRPFVLTALSFSPTCSPSTVGRAISDSDWLGLAIKALPINSCRLAIIWWWWLDDGDWVLPPQCKYHDPWSDGIAATTAFLFRPSFLFNLAAWWPYRPLFWRRKKKTCLDGDQSYKEASGGGGGSGGGSGPEERKDDDGEDGEWWGSDDRSMAMGRSIDPSFDCPWLPPALHQSSRVSEWVMNETG